MLHTPKNMIFAYNDLGHLIGKTSKAEKHWEIADESWSVLFSSLPDNQKSLCYNKSGECFGKLSIAQSDLMGLIAFKMVHNVGLTASQFRMRDHGTLIWDCFCS